MKRVLALILAVMMVLTLCACGSQSSTSSTTAQATEAIDIVEAAKEANQQNTNIVTQTTEGTGERLVKIGITGDPVTFSPWEANSVGRRAVLHNIYQMLAQSIVNPDTGKFDLYNVIMSGYDHEDETGTYTIHIREGIYDTAGNKIDANDVAFSYRSAAESGFSSKAKKIQEITVVDDYTLIFEFGQVLGIGAFDDYLTDVFIVSQASYEASGDNMASNPIGSTGYVLSDYKVGSSCTITLADIPYWNQAANESKSLEDGYCYLYDTTNVDTVEFDFILDTSTMAFALESGEIDIASTVSTADAEHFRTGGALSDSVSVWQFPADLLSVAPNMSESSPMSNINLRKALFYSFDNETIIKGCFDSDGTVVHSWSATVRGDYDPKYESLDYFGYNPETAKEYLNKYYEETGTTVNDLNLVLLCSNQETYSKAAQLIQNFFCEVAGSDTAMTLLCVDDSIFEATYADPTAFDIVLDAEASETRYGATAWRRAALASELANGYAKYFIDDDHLQELLITAIGESTHSQETCNAFNDYVIEMAYRKCIGYGSTYRAASSWVGQILKGPKAITAVCGMKYDWAAKEA